MCMHVQCVGTSKLKNSPQPGLYRAPTANYMYVSASLQHCQHTAGILAAGRVVYSAQQIPLADTHKRTKKPQNYIQ